MDSSVDVCDLMIRLVCGPCSNRECEEPIWSHSKLMDCIRKPIHEVDIHMRRTNEPRGVNDCNSFTTEGKGDIPDGYPMDCANCSNCGDEEKCPVEPRILSRTIKVGELPSDGSFGVDLGGWSVIRIVPHREAPP